MRIEEVLARSKKDVDFKRILLAQLLEIAPVKQFWGHIQKLITK